MASGNYNTPPLKWEEISEQQYYSYLFSYITKSYEFRQLLTDEHGKKTGQLLPVHIQELAYENAADLGIAISYDFKNLKPKYFRFGGEDNWKKFSSEFAFQFRRDNS